MNNTELSEWTGRISRALAIQQQQHKSWRDAIDLYNCKYFDKIYGGFDSERVDVNFANWYITSLIPLVYFRDPFIFVKPRNDSYSSFAETMEEVINYYWKELHLKKQIKKVIQSAFLSPPGWIKLGYTAKIGQDVAKIDEIKQKTLIQQIKNTITEVFKEKKETLPEEKGILDMNISEENLFATWISSWNMLMAPGYHLVSQMPYLIEIEDLPLIDFNSNPLYSNKNNVKPSREISEKGNSAILSKPNYAVASGKKDDEQQIIRLYHIWDRRSQKRYTISDKETHFEGKWCYDMDGFPYKPLIFEESLPNADESNPYPINVIVPILPQVIEKSQARTMMVKHRKRAAALILVQKGILTEEEIDNLSESEVMQIVEVSNLAAAQPFVLPPLPPDVYSIDLVNDKDLQMATNMGQLMFQAQPGQRTATQAQLGQAGLQLKASARVDVVEDFTVEIASGLAQLAWQFCDRDKITEILGKPVTDNMWPDLPKNPYERKRVIKSEFQFRIDAGSAAPPKDETVDKKQILDLASIVASIAPERLNKGEFVKQLLKRFKFAEDLDRIVITNDEEEMKTAQLENELMLQNHPQTVSPNENHEIHISIHQQVAGNELADQHLLTHGQYLGIKQSSAQKGDTRPPVKSANPEINRQGITNRGDISQSVQNLGVGTGAEAM